MATLSEESLNKWTKAELVALFIDFEEKMDTIQSNICDEVRNLQEQVSRIRLCSIKNAFNLLPQRLVSMERQCLANSVLKLDNTGMRLCQLNLDIKKLLNSLLDDIIQYFDIHEREKLPL